MFLLKFVWIPSIWTDPHTLALFHSSICCKIVLAWCRWRGFCSCRSWFPFHILPLFLKSLLVSCWSFCGLLPRRSTSPANSQVAKQSSFDGTLKRQRLDIIVSATAMYTFLNSCPSTAITDSSFFPSTLFLLPSFLLIHDFHHLISVLHDDVPWTTDQLSWSSTAAYAVSQQPIGIRSIDHHHAQSASCVVLSAMFGVTCKKTICIRSSSLRSWAIDVRFRLLNVQAGQ